MLEGAFSPLLPLVRNRIESLRENGGAEIEYKQKCNKPNIPGL